MINGKRINTSRKGPAVVFSTTTAKREGGVFIFLHYLLTVDHLHTADDCCKFSSLCLFDIPIASQTPLNFIRMKIVHIFYSIRFQ